MIDQASVFAERYKGRPQILQATVLGQGGDPHLDPYTALRALQLIKESNQMAMARQAQQPTSAPSILSDAMTPPQPPVMPMGAPVGMGARPPQAPMPQGPAPQAPVMQASGGLAAMHVPEEHYAGGGILAFSGEDGSYVEPKSADASDTSRLAEQYGLYGEGKLSDEDTGDEDTGTSATPDSQKYSRFGLQQLAAALRNNRDMTPAQQAEFLSSYIANAKRQAGPDIYGPALADQAAREEARKANMGQQSGLALLQAAGAVLKGHSLGEGISNAAPAYAGAMGEAMRADQAEKRAIEQMNFALADAKRKESQGLYRDANVALGEARKFQRDAAAASMKLAELGIRGAKATQVPLPRATPQAPANVQLRDSFAAQYMAKNPKMTETEAKALGARDVLTLPQNKSITSNITTTSNLPETDPRAVQGAAKLNATQNDVLSKHMDSWEDSTEARKAKKTGTYDALYKAEYDKKYSELLRGVVSEAPPPVNLRGTTSAPRTSTPPPPPGYNLNTR